MADISSIVPVNPIVDMPKPIHDKKEQPKKKRQALKEDENLEQQNSEVESETPLHIDEHV